MTRIPTLVLLAGLAGPALAADDSPKAGPTDNKPPEGFVALFDGKTLDGWQGAVDIGQKAKLKPEELADRQKKANEVAKQIWAAEDGVITLTPKKGVAGVSLAAVKDYADFELYVGWKIEAKGDSGLYLRGTPQIQIWDSDSLTGGLAADKGTGSGGLWNNPAKSAGKTPLRKADKPVGAVERVPHHHEGGQGHGRAQRRNRGRCRPAESLRPVRVQGTAGERPHRVAVPRGPALVQEHLRQGIEVTSWYAATRSRLFARSAPRRRIPSFQQRERHG